MDQSGDPASIVREQSGQKLVTPDEVVAISANAVGSSIKGLNVLSVEIWRTSFDLRVAHDVALSGDAVIRRHEWRCADEHDRIYRGVVVGWSNRPHSTIDVRFVSTLRQNVRLLRLEIPVATQKAEILTLELDR